MFRKKSESESKQLEMTTNDKHSNFVTELHNQIERINEIIMHPKLYLDHRETLDNIHNSIIDMIEDYPRLSKTAIIQQIPTQILTDSLINEYRSKMIEELKSFKKLMTKNKAQAEEIVSTLTSEEPTIKTKYIEPALEYEDDNMFDLLNGYVDKTIKNCNVIPYISSLSNSQLSKIKSYYDVVEDIKTYYQDLIDTVTDYENQMVTLNIKLTREVTKNVLDIIYNQHLNDCKKAMVEDRAKKSQQTWFHDEITKFITDLVE